MLREAYEERLSCATARYLIIFCLTNREGESKDMWLGVLVEAYNAASNITQEQFLHTLCGLANTQTISDEDFNKIYNRFFTGENE